MKTIGIQIKSSEAIVVVLEKDALNNITQTNECSKFKIDEPNDHIQVKQFRDQINATFDLVGPAKIGIITRNANGKGEYAPSPISFKLEGIIQLYDKVEVEFVAPKTITTYFKKNNKTVKSKNVYQENAFDLAYYLFK